MTRLMRCQYCGLLQDEPVGVKACTRCGGELVFEDRLSDAAQGSYLEAQMELDQVMAPAGQNVDRYLLITLRTPSGVLPEQAAPTESGRLPFNFTAVLDVSGSMHGSKLMHTKEAVRQSMLRLQDGDMLSLATFANEVHCVIEPTEMDPDTRQLVSSALDEITAGGLTALCSGLEMGIEKAATVKQDTNLVLLLSDGQANVGETDLELVGQRGFQGRQRGIIISTLGVGGDYNEALMAEIATQGGGRFYHIKQASQIGAYLTGELGEVAALAARDAEIQLQLPTGAVLFPLSAAYPARQDGDQVVISIGGIPEEVDLEIPLRLSIPSQPVGARLSVEGNVTYLSPAGNPLFTGLNRVTVRFKDAAAYELRDGVIPPVIEQVLKQREAAQVLNFSRAIAIDPS
ncbi:MAG: VWA domain-containing protein, partial [Chloroflexota bacterium]|nr:VWA domain-containing protein [Chloroflexota bacterium]